MRCKACGLTMTDTGEGFTTHSSCDDTPEAQRIRAAYEARRAGIEGMALAGVAHPDDKAAGLALLRATALSMPFFNADDVREKYPQWDDLDSHVRGNVFSTAATARYSYVTATSQYLKSRHKPTKGHPIQTWKSLIYVDEFAVGLTPGKRAS